MLLAGTMGLYGVMLGFIAINIHLISMKSFGMSYMTPQSPLILQDLKDFIIRGPAKKMKKRPVQSYAIDMVRMDMDERENHEETTGIE